jgi:hypothetical protein
MRIENLESNISGERARISAKFVWEESDRPTQDIFYETPIPFAQDLTCNPHAFLLAGMMPAMHGGERRIALDAEICPELKDGLMTVMSWMHHWFEPHRSPIAIEAKTRSHNSTPHSAERAGCFFSGGIDSLATLRHNRLTYPLDHPASIKDGLIIYGLEFQEPEIYQKQVMQQLSTIAEAASITLIPVYTNVRRLNENWSFWLDEFQGAVLASVAHVFSRRLTTVSIASSDDIQNLTPLGSHPLIDPNYSSSDLRIYHNGNRFSRLDKTRLIADWEAALHNVKVCFKTQLQKSGKVNCGRCEKCLRTMTTLIALDKLEQSQAFDQHDVSVQDLMQGAYINPGLEGDYRVLIPLLKERGRQDLIRGIDRITQRGREQDLKGIVKRLNRVLLQGNR